MSGDKQWRFVGRDVEACPETNSGEMVVRRQTVVLSGDNSGEMVVRRQAMTKEIGLISYERNKLD